MDGQIMSASDSGANPFAFKTVFILTKFFSAETIRNPISQPALSRLREIRNQRL